MASQILEIRIRKGVQFNPHTVKILSTDKVVVWEKDTGREATILARDLDPQKDLLLQRDKRYTGQYQVLEITAKPVR